MHEIFNSMKSLLHFNVMPGCSYKSCWIPFILIGFKENRKYLSIASQEVWHKHYNKVFSILPKISRFEKAKEKNPIQTVKYASRKGGILSQEYKTLLFK